MIQKERIINGCEELFLEAGIKTITMDDIARHIGVSKKTIYQSYANKEELVYDYVRQKTKNNQQQVYAKVTQPGNAINKLSSLEIPFREIFVSVNPIAIHDLKKYYPAAWLLIHRFKSEFLAGTIENLLKEGIEDGLIRPEIDARIIARMCVIQMEMIFDQSWFPVAEYDLWKLQSQFFDHFNFGLGTKKGIALFTTRIDEVN